MGKVVVDEIKAALLELIGERPGTSFVEICQEIPNAKGDLGFGDADRNLVYWTGVSAELVEAINSLLSAKKIKMSGTSFLTYFVDGATRGLKLAKKFRAYKHPRWLPVAFRLTG